MPKPNWIAVDWGTSHLRAYAMGANGVQDRAQSTDGMGSLSRDQFEPALLRLIDPWLSDHRTPVLACGMVGSRQGWAEAPYAPVPAKPGTLPPVHVRTHDPRLSVHIIPGLSQTDPGPDVMRGEETQIAGFLHQTPNFNGTACLPGTHTKWAQISAEEVVSFQTFMTGEMYHTLATTTVLRHSLSGDGWDDDAFLNAVDDAISYPERTATRLFQLRAADLLVGQSSGTARARLSGLLIGMELAAARPYWLGLPVALIGADGPTAAYEEALKSQGVTPQIMPAEDATLAGLSAAYTSLSETAQ